MNDHSNYYWQETLFGLIALILVVGVGWIVVQQQVIQTAKYCQGLVDNGTIHNISECNITVEAEAETKIGNYNISMVT